MCIAHPSSIDTLNEFNSPLMDVLKVMRVSIIIPAYNEEETIGKVLRSILKLNDLNPFEIIVVDDGSEDKTFEKVQPFGIKLIRCLKNHGKGRALRIGLKMASGDIIIWQDADLEYFPSDIPKLLQPIIQKSAAIVYGSRFYETKAQMSVSHFLGNKILTWTTRILFNCALTDMETGYKAFRREVFDYVELNSDGFEIEPEVTAKILTAGFRITEVPINYRYRRKGKAKIGWRDGIKSLFILFRLRFCK